MQVKWYQLAQMFNDAMIVKLTESKITGSTELATGELYELQYINLQFTDKNKPRVVGEIKSTTNQTKLFNIESIECYFENNEVYFLSKEYDAASQAIVTFKYKCEFFGKQGVDRSDLLNESTSSNSSNSQCLSNLAFK